MSALEIASPETRRWIDLSLAQRAVWFDATLSTAPSAYTLVRWARITGSIDLDVAGQALTLVVARHDALRLRVDAEFPRQWLSSSARAPFDVIDLTGFDDPQRELEAHIERAMATPMPLGDNPLFAFDLLLLRAHDAYVFMRCHHLLADEAAVTMILHHWLAAYGALTSDTAPELAPPSSYLAVIEADDEYARSARYQSDLAYWSRRFASLSPALLPAAPPPLPLGTGTSRAEQRRPCTANWTLGAISTRVSAPRSRRSA